MAYGGRRISNKHRSLVEAIEKGKYREASAHEQLM
jgi:hypothetical protein